ncbi:MAG: D-aminoacylase [Actinomycetia bacterium]|nr:D-aminoacylase [Actinomycetes bacterium]
MSEPFGVAGLATAKPLRTAQRLRFAMASFDVLIRGGLVVDGSGRTGSVNDVAVTDGRVVVIDDLSGAEAAVEIDASGKVVAPGFIDIHTHSDMAHFVDPRAESQIRQGVTTEAIGQCGISLAPCTPHNRAALFAQIGSWEHGHWHTYGELLEAMDDAHIATNVVGMVGHGALRTAVMGPNEPRPATDDEIAEMERMLRQSLEEGAFGFTTGLEYHPGKSATYDELASLCGAVADVDGIYATHSRNRDLRYFVGFGEALDVARDTGVRLQISHINPKYGRPEHALRNTLQMIEWTREEGVDVAMDMMPTNWNHTAATSLLPAWSFRLSNDELLELLGTADGRRRLRDNSLPMWQLAVEERWDRIRLLACSANGNLAGRTIDELTIERNTSSGWDTIFDLLIEEGPGLKGLMLTGEAFAEEDNRLALEHPLCSVESDTMAMANDGPLAGRMMGVLGYNWVAKFLAHYVRDEQVLGLEDGVRRLTGLPSDRLGLADRGYLAEGFAADVVVFDLAAMRDNSSFSNPTVYADGIDHVLVNGAVAFSGGERSSDHSGRVLRRTG